ncbi:MAG: carboxypeptidase regulatory-like domain-containing protein [Patescibacteria group bacterium]
MNTSGCGVNVSQSSCTANISCNWISGSGFNYCDTKSSYGGDSNSCPGFAYSRWDSSGKRYCQLNQARACQYVYPDYIDVTKYTTASCPISDGGNVATSTTSGVPITPGNVRAILQANGDVNISWNDYATNENEYKIEWKNLSGTWVIIGTTPIVYGGSGFYTDHPSSGRTHEYRVKACNTAGCSSESNFATVTIGGTDKIPVMTSLSVRTGPIGTRVTITGTGFDTVRNRVNFDTGVIMDIPSPNGTSLVFTVPEDRVPLCAVTDPRCLLPAPYNPVKLGTYPVSVTTLNGTSAWFSFMVTEQQASVFAVDGAGSYPKSGQTAVETGTRIRVKLTREFDPKSTAQEFFRLTKDTAPAVRLNGTFSIASDGFEFTPSQELEFNADYTYTVLGTLKDKSGMSLSPFTASFTTGSGAGRLGGTLTGKVNGSDGKAVARAMVYVFSYQNSFWRTVETDISGSFQTLLPAGTYFVEVHPPFTSADLDRASPREVKILAGETQNLAFVLGGAIKIITGTVAFSNGSVVTDAEVGAYASETKQWENVTVDAKGSYTLKVGGGVWFIGLHPRDADRATWLWNEPPRRVVFSKDQNSETKPVDFVVPLSNTTITVTTVDDMGAVLGDTGVVIDSGRFTQVTGSSFGFVPPEFRVTDANGKAVFTLRAGAYFVRAYLPSDRGYFNPEEQQVTVAGGDAKEIKMVFRKRQQARASVIRGITILEQGLPVDAFVWAWSERGGFVSTRSDENGTFSITVLPNDRWHIGAGKEYKEFGYKSTELTVDVKNDPIAVEIVLIKQVLTSLPSTVNVTQTAQSQIVAQATDGAQVTLPPASATSTSMVQLEINPTLEAPTQAGTKVMSTVYDVTVRDGSGKEITSLAQEAEFIIPYSEEELKDQGVSEDAIVPSFFDEKTGTWVTIDDYTIDKERNVIITRIKHLTRFAITAAADITPPSAPATVSAQIPGAGKIKVIWKNPAKDFDYAKIYRSLKEGEIGIVRGASVRGEQFIDEEGISANNAYYYTVRAVDTAGNESINTTQVRILASGSSGRVLAPSVSVRLAGALSRTLRRGMSGDDVKLLQNVLAADGVFTDQATGFFGKLTEAAVIRFQEKYAAEILRPVSLSQGTGIVGPGTRKKINGILKK